MKKDILQNIIANKRIEVARQKQAVSLQTLLALGSDRMERDTRSMRAALESSPSGIISEFKRKSPSKGWLHPGANIADVVPAYEAGGASACSILTDGDFFGGSLGDLQKARKLVDLPLLRKDFIIDTYQLFQARVMGADAVLLIAAALTEEECRVLAETAHSLQLEVLLEVHSEDELKYLNADIDMLGVNNRNLGTFHTDVNNSFKLVDKMRGFSPLLVSESGISETDTVRRLRRGRFPRIPDRRDLHENREAGRYPSRFYRRTGMIIKVCGMREPQNIREVAALAINWIGFIFYERSKRFVERCPTEQQVTDSEQLSPKKVGVFVNATIESMMEKASAYKLDYLQLHGNESPEDCHTLQKRGYSLIKAFPIATKEDFEKTREYEGQGGLFPFRYEMRGLWRLRQTFRLVHPNRI